MNFIRKIITFSGILAVFCLGISAQGSSEADSLAALLNNTEGEEHLQILFSLASSSYLSKQERTEYSEEAINYASGMSDPEHLIEANLRHGQLMYQEIDDYESSLRSLENAAELSQQNDNPDKLATSYMWLGRVHTFLNDTLTGQDYLDRALNIADENDIQEIKAGIFFLMARQKMKYNKQDEAIEDYNRALAIAEEVNDPKLLAEIYDDIAGVMFRQGNYPEATPNYEQAAINYLEAGEDFNAGRMYFSLGSSNIQVAKYDVALEYLQKALAIFEEHNSYPGIVAVSNSYGVIYFKTEIFDKALEMYESNLERASEMGDKDEMGRAYNNIGNVYNRLAEDSLKTLFGERYQDSVKVESTDKYLKLFDQALANYNLALPLWTEVGNLLGQVTLYSNIGIIYVFSGKPALALEPLEKGAELNEQLGDRGLQSTFNYMLAQVYMAFENYNTALDYLNNALEITQEIDFRDMEMSVLNKLSEAHQKQNNHALALNYYKLYFQVFEEINQESSQNAIADMQVKYETDILEAKNQAQEEKLKTNRIIIGATIGAIVVFIILLLQLFRQNHLKKLANRELAMKNELITEQKKEITDSIQYASRIQNAMLPPGDYVDNLMPERFIMFMPRDIVSGDYYYITEKDGKIICVTADCTGHGVPGAFMSMLGIAFLNEIISKHTELHTDQMLFELRNHVIKSLHQTGKEGESQDGMDVALYILDRENNKLEFSGANNSLFVFRNGEMIEKKADKMPIGIHTRAKEPFTRHNLDLHEGDMLYTFSDGYPDQFGGPKQKKFMIKKFKELLQEIHTKPMQEQKKVMEKTLADWMEETEQVDDILVIGVRI